jgi:hypothetical protein
MARKPRPEPRTADDRAAAHRRQVNLQIWLPLILGSVIVLGLAGLTVLGAVQGSGDVTRWSNLSAVYLLIPTLLSSLLTIAVLVLCIYGLSKLSKKMPGWLAVAQSFIMMVPVRVRQLADRLVAPVISVNSASGGMSGAFRTLFTRKRN